MTAPVEVPVPVTGDTDSDDRLGHCYCDCDMDLALCGTDISGQDFFDGAVTDAPLPCVVCVDMEFLPCPRCGAVP